MFTERGELKQEGRALPVQPQLGTCAVGTILCMSVSDRTSTSSIDLGLQTQFRDWGEFCEYKISEVNRKIDRYQQIDT